MAKRKIYSITIIHLHDDDPDTSYYGEYSDTPDSAYSIDRAALGDTTHSGQYKYFNPSQNYNDCPPDEVRKNVAQDYARMQAYNRGDWHYIGIRASASVGVSINSGKDYLTQVVSSGGLWGIESDSDRQFLGEVEAQELADLRAQLLVYGFSARMIDNAIKLAAR